MAKSNGNKTKSKGNAKAVRNSAIASDKQVIRVQTMNIFGNEKELKKAKKSLERLTEAKEGAEKLLGYQRKFVEFFESNPKSFDVVNQNSAKYSFEIDPIFRDLAYKNELHNRKGMARKTENSIKDTEKLLSQKKEFITACEEAITESNQFIKEAQDRLKGYDVVIDLDEVRKEVESEN